jgi:hypothetical protein
MSNSFISSRRHLCSFSSCENPTKPIPILTLYEIVKSCVEDESDYEGVDSTSDMDGDGNPDWNPAVGPGV